MTTQMERRAANARRAAAEQAGERGGEGAFLQRRSQAPYPTQRREPAVGQQLRAEPEQRNGKTMLHTSGYFTAYGKPYPMWDEQGRYEEVTCKGSGAATLARKPDLGFLVNHTGVTMARTRTGTLLLREDDHGGFHDAYMNLERGDVSDLAEAIKDGDVSEMSFAFYIPDGAGLWSDDWTTFEIRAYDLERGDVSAVNYGANPFTDIAARSGGILRALDALPAGARVEAAQRLGVGQVEEQMQARERIQVTSRTVDRTASQHVRNLQWRTANTARRMAELAAETGLPVADLATARLPWYEIRAASPISWEQRQASAEAVPTDDDLADQTDVLIYDEIGGSFGVTADQFAADLADIDTPRINLRINSPGGSVMDALAIANSLRHKSDDGTRIVSYSDGLVASAATIIAIAADEVVAMPGSEWMAHFASTTVDGNKIEAGKMATFLDFQDRNIADQYAAKSGGTQAEWLAMMEAETWFTGEDAQNAGLVDRLWSSGNRQRGERALDDPRMRRDRWQSLPFRYQSRADAPVTQQRRAYPAEQMQEASTRTVEQALAELEPGWATTPAQVKDGGSTPVKPSGRSIALIEAEMSADGVNLSGE